MIDELRDEIILGELILDEAKKQKKSLDIYVANVADIMEKLKTDAVKAQLAEITQANYKKMIELEINIAGIEKILKDQRKMVKVLECLGNA